MGIKEGIFGKPGEPQPAKEIYISNLLDIRQLYEKAYLIEFLGEDGKGEEVFTFSLPPESEELSYTQRKSETKTFGGLHVDEYGIDAVKIVLSGSTVNQSLKRIYKGGEDDKWLSGEEEIYYLRDLIMQYKTGVENIKKRIMIYDLSKIRHRGAGTITPIKNYWQAFPGDFKIRRSSDRPFTYKYSFEFTGVSLSTYFQYTSHGKPPKSDPATMGLLKEIMENLLKALYFIDRIKALVNNVLDYVNKVNQLLKVLGNLIAYAARAISDIIDSVGDVIAGFIDGLTSIVDGVTSVVSLPRTIVMASLSVGIELQNAADGLVKSCDALASEFRDMYDRGGGGEGLGIPREVLDQYGMSDEEFKDSVSLMIGHSRNIANEIAAAAKSSEIPDVTIGSVDPETGDQRIILSYGYTTTTLKETDTLESLAKQHFGDPDKAIDIATYNGFASLSDLQPGDTIKLPITNKTPKMANNLIFARIEDRDNYGRDILLTDDGRFVPSTSGDYALVSGTKNLSQSILLRLRESVDKRIRMNTYGIRTNISDRTAGISYIVSSIELTVKSDPRVSSVDDIRFSSGGDYLDVNVEYSDINKDRGNVRGRV